jgi:type IV pilus assembly protein PilC
LPIRSLDVELSLNQLAVMLRGGLTLLSAMQNIAEQTPRASMRKVWQAVSREVQRGKGFAAALEAHRCFPTLVVQLARIGEQTGTLEPVLRRGAESMERRRTLRNALLMALSYPLLVLISAMGVTAFMVLNVIPKIQVFLVNLGRQLPPMTQLLLDISDAARTYLPHASIFSVVTCIALWACYLWTPGRYAIDYTLLRIPLFGYFIRLAATALVSRSLSILLQSGVTLLEGLKTMESLHANRYLRQHLANARLQVIDGGNLATAIKDPLAYLPMLPAMVAVGESAGTLDEVLEETARFQEEQLQTAIRQLSAIIEPVILVVVGSIVGFVYIAFFMALFAAAGSGG